MNRDERESLLEELAMAKSRADEMRAVARHLAKFAPNHGAAKDVYEETANFLVDLADDFERAKPFAAMRRRLEEDDQAQADADMAADRRAYRASVL